MRDCKKYCLRIILATIAILCFTACQPDPYAPARRTVVVYMAADNSLLPFARMDEREINSVKNSIDKDCHIVVYVDTTAESLDANRMHETLLALYRANRAESYGLVLWSHGKGWQGFGVNRDKRRLAIPDLKRVLRDLPHLDFLLFDACHMQAAEVIYELRDFADYIIGSPAEIPGTGAPYDRIVPLMFEKDVRAACLSMAETYYSHYEHLDGCVISAVETADFCRYLEQVAPRLIEICHSGAEPELFGLQHYTTYGAASDYMPDLYDLGSLLARLATDVPRYQPLFFAATKTWTTTNPMDIFHQMIDAEHSIGITLFVPSAAYARGHIAQYLDLYSRLAWYGYLTDTTSLPNND